MKLGVSEVLIAERSAEVFGVKSRAGREERHAHRVGVLARLTRGIPLHEHRVALSVIEQRKGSERCRRGRNEERNRTDRDPPSALNVVLSRFPPAKLGVPFVQDQATSLVTPGARKLRAARTSSCAVFSGAISSVASPTRIDDSPVSFASTSAQAAASTVSAGTRHSAARALSDLEPRGVTGTRKGAGLEGRFRGHDHVTQRAAVI